VVEKRRVRESVGFDFYTFLFILILIVEKNK
jgi:hypothetical protein